MAMDLLTRFKLFVKEPQAPSAIVAWLQNEDYYMSQLLDGTIKNCTPEIYNEIADFCEYFDNNFSEVTEAARYLMLDDEPLIFKIFWKMNEMMEMRQQQMVFNSLPKYYRDAAGPLSEAILNIDGHKEILIRLGEHDNINDSYNCEIPDKLLPGEECYKDYLKHICGTALAHDLIIMVFIRKMGVEEVYGFQCEKGKWSPIPEKELEERLKRDIEDNPAFGYEQHLKACSVE